MEEDVDLRIDPRRPRVILDLSDESRKHLREASRDAALAAPAPANERGGGDGRAPAQATSFAWRALRQSPRVRCSGTVEFRTEGNGACLWGTLTDISLHGCYVEMTETFPADTNVYLVLKSLGIRVQTRGTVRTLTPSGGMGIAFTEIEPGQLQQLQLLLDALTGGSTIHKGGLARGNSDGIVGSVDPIAFLDEITEFFRKKPLLSREEFQHIAKRVRRP